MAVRPQLRKEMAKPSCSPSVERKNILGPISSKRNRRKAGTRHSSLSGLRSTKTTRKNGNTRRRTIRWRRSRRRIARGRMIIGRKGMRWEVPIEKNITRRRRPSSRRITKSRKRSRRRAMQTRRRITTTVGVTATDPIPSTYHSSQRDSGALSMTMRRNGERGGLGARRIWMNGRTRKHANLEETCWQPDAVMFVYIMSRLHTKGLNSNAERN